jgi:hypothetical protein
MIVRQPVAAPQFFQGANQLCARFSTKPISPIDGGQTEGLSRRVVPAAIDPRMPAGTL